MRQGFMLALTMIVVAMISASLMIFATRISVDISARRSAEIRSQSLWLARSALLSGHRGEQTVETDLGTATVRVSGDVAEVSLQGATARVSSSPWSESFVSAPATPD